MPAVDLDDQPFIDPDELKVPESPEHHRVSVLIATVAEILLPDSAVYVDMNWYPRDGGNAVAPDVMVLPVGCLPHRAKSYKQPAGGPVPSVVVEVASDTDSYSSFISKTARYRRLGVPTYSVTIEDDDPGVIRCSDSSSDLQAWTGRPIPELGGISIDVVDGEVAVRMPDGQLLYRAADIRSNALARAADADDRADSAERRAAAMAEKLGALGIDPDEV
jgi:Putative restriction endonuclease